MNSEILDRNLSALLEEMELQTGKRPGGRTGLCHLVALAALTGESLDWEEVVKFEAQTREQYVGLKWDTVKIEDNHQALEAVPALLEQKIVPIDAILIAGQLRGETGDSGWHMIGAVPIDNSNYRVIDSLLPGANLSFEETLAVKKYIERSFDPDSLYLRVVPTKSERMRRKRQVRLHGYDDVRVANGVSVLVPRLKQPEFH